MEFLENVILIDRALRDEIRKGKYLGETKDYFYLMDDKAVKIVRTYPKKRFYLKKDKALISIKNN